MYGPEFVRNRFPEVLSRRFAQLSMPASPGQAVTDRVICGLLNAAQEPVPKKKNAPLKLFPPSGHLYLN
jgi:hypothetical protein